MKQNLSDEIYARLQKRVENKSANIDKIDIEQILNELSIYEAELLAQNKELIHSEKKLVQSQQAYYHLFQDAPTPLVVIDNEFNIIHSNIEAKKNFDITSKYIQKINLQRVLDSSSVGLFSLWVEQKKYENEPIVCEVKCKDKTLQYFLINGRKEEQNTLFLTLSNISKQKELEKKYKDQKEELETIFHYAQEGIAVTNEKGDFLIVNKTMEEITGYTHDELLTKNCNDLTALEDREKNKQALDEAFQKGRINNFEKDCIVNNGIRITVNVGISLLPDKKSLLFLIKDTTSLKLLEKQSKLASMGEMIGNIAHQWRQPLSLISTAASGMRLQSDFDNLSKEELVHYTELIIQQSEYLSQTIDSFRDFLKGDKNHKKISIKDTLEYTLSLVEAAIKNNNITIIKNIQDNLYIEGSINELSEAFINIINNSKDALKERVSEDENRLIFIDTFLSPKKDKIIIEFKDNGGGISLDIIDKIFEPYFTSKHKSVGTGLGLSMSEKIIQERHNGIISVKNTQFTYDNLSYVGACFQVVFQIKD